MRRAPGAVTHLIDKVWALGIVPHTESWIESDGSPASAPKRRGFGTIVMEAMAERSVGSGVAATSARRPSHKPTAPRHPRH
jgi:hypothetical protein